ncbi:MAG: hypothetical protein P8100_04220 [bacterium]
MAVKKQRKKSRKPGNNSLWVFLAIIIVLAIISMLISYFWVSDEKPDVFLLPSSGDQETVATDQPREQEQTRTNPVDGTWISHYDGAMLTISGNSFTLELPGIDETGTARGVLTLEGNICTFVIESGSESCLGTEGHYLYSLTDDGELHFELIKDICSSRKERMTANWFKL